MVSPTSFRGKFKVEVEVEVPSTPWFGGLGLPRKEGEGEGLLKPSINQKRLCRPALCVYVCVLYLARGPATHSRRVANML